MAKRKNRDAIRKAIWKQAEELNVPAFMTPLWQQLHGKPVEVK